ncbi:MAG: hypothetical protein IJC48_09095 [Clostridia bacterium]|nr:hypothetical protein [Clostridia bacterium]
MDREILRTLAARIREISEMPIQAEKRELHRAVNSKRMIRPVVLMDELPWNQLNGSGELTLKCENAFLRRVEDVFRKTLWKYDHCPCDMLVEPFYALPRSITIGDIGISAPIGEVRMADKGNNIISRSLQDQLSSFDALEKLHVPEIYADDDKTNAEKEMLTDIFGDLLPVKTVGLNHAGFLCPWDDLSFWRGVEAIYMDLYDEPELLHETMKRIMDIKKQLLEKEIELELLDDYLPLLHCTASLTDELPGKKENGKTLPKNMWARGMAQVFASVSPRMHDEFEIRYVKEYFDNFGLLYYGCCEPLHDKIEILKQFKNLRKISITPWADVRKAAERMGRDYVMARKPNPAAVGVLEINEDALRKDILETLDACRENETPVEFTLKDISSVCYKPENLEKWERIVMETVLNY